MSAITRHSNYDYDLKPAEATEELGSSWRWFHPSLARAINQKQPDITAAIFLFGLHTWKNNYDWTLVDGKRHCFRSLSQSATDHTYFNPKAIEKVVTRAKKKGFVETTKKKGKTLYHLPNHVTAHFKKKKGRIWYHVGDAEAYGIEASLLLANLQWQSEKLKNHVKDENGNLYYALAPIPLSEYLPMSHWTIRRHLESLLDHPDQPIIRHPTEKHYYRRRLPGEELQSTENVTFAESGENEAEVGNDPAEVGEIQKGDVNLDVIVDEKWLSPTRLASASPAQDTSVRSSLPNELRTLIEATKLPRKNESVHSSKGQGKLQFTIVEEDGEEYQIVTDKIPAEALPYDTLPDSQLIQDRITFEAEQLAQGFHLRKLRCTKKDEMGFRQVFFDNPHLCAEDLLAVLAACWELRTGIPSEGVTLGERYQKVDDPACLTFSKRVRSAEYFLKRLREIVVELSGDDMDECFRTMCFASLEKQPTNKVVERHPNYAPIGKVRVPYSSCPC